MKAAARAILLWCLACAVGAAGTLAFVHLVVELVTLIGGVL